MGSHSIVPIKRLKRKEIEKKRGKRLDSLEESLLSPKSKEI